MTHVNSVLLCAWEAGGKRPRFQEKPYPQKRRRSGGRRGARAHLFLAVFLSRPKVEPSFPIERADIGRFGFTE